jgi:sugar lactone lactonase YvrE
MRAFFGDGGQAATAALNLPVSVVFDQQWNMIIGDQANQRVRKVDHATGVISTVAGQDPCADGAPCELGDGGPALQAHFAFPPGQAARPGGRVEIDGAGNLFVADTAHYRVRKIDTAGVITTVAGTGMPGTAGDGGPAAEAQVSRVADVAVSPDGLLYIADTENNCIRMVDGAGIISTAVGHCGQQGFAGDGQPVAEAVLNRPYGIAFDPQGNLYIADTHNNRIRVVYR